CYLASTITPSSYLGAPPGVTATAGAPCDAAPRSGHHPLFVFLAARACAWRHGGMRVLTANTDPRHPTAGTRAHGISSHSRPSVFALPQLRNAKRCRARKPRCLRRERPGAGNILTGRDV